MKRNITLLAAIALLLAAALSVLVLKTDCTEIPENSEQKSDMTLTVFHYMMLKSHLDGLDEMERQYSELHPEYNITWNNVVYNQGTDYFPQLQLALANGEQPEIIMGNPGLYPDIVELGFAADLTDNEVLNSSDFSREDLNDASYKGKVYAFPIDYKTWGVFYNKKIYAELGLHEPETHTELLENCRIISQAGYDPWVHSFGDAVFGDIELRNYVWTMAIKNGDTDLFESLMNGNRKFSDYPYFEKGLDLWGKRMQWFRDDSMTNNQTAALQAFTAGQGAMYYTGTWSVAMIEALSDGTDFEYGFFFEPIDDENKALMNVQTNGVFMVNPRSKNFATALDFMQFWEKNGSIWAEKTYMPLCSGELPESVPEVIRMMTEEKKAGNIAHYGAFTEPLSSRFTIDYRNVLTAYAESLIGGNPMTPERCLAEMQKKFDLDITQK